ncbi:hypothetical protein ACFVT5_28125 [Streptomyces sp. NPDC058001]|uniref:hypothetical protein n=1 Tax=Streptomyces sp. NPDC058001 TaxID=3346300 RepID=UPI0036EF6BD4
MGATTQHGTGTRVREDGTRWDLVAVGAAVVLVVGAIVVGVAIERDHGTLFVAWPPLFARWDPHVGPGTPAALAVAAATVAYGPGLAARLPWRALLGLAWATAMAWTWSLALVDGWQRGVAGRLAKHDEYLPTIDRFHDIGATLRDFTHHILSGSPDHWPTHVAGHPPAAILTFVGLDRVGLGGGGWAAAWVITTGTSAVLAVLVTVRALAGEATARRAAPFLALAPLAVWVGVSADGCFTGVAAWSVALLTLAATRRVRAPWAAAFGAGLLFGLSAYLSYGLILFVVILAAVLALTRTLRPVPWLLLGTALVTVAFTLAGFDWWEAYRLLVDRYHEGVGGIRPQSYWIWANLACQVFAVGLATVAGLRRAGARTPPTVARLRRGRDRTPDRLIGLLAVVAVALLAADVSGMSKAETERIWLPFTVWLLAATALLPARTRRGWLAAQAVLALLVNHLLLTGW